MEQKLKILVPRLSTPSVGGEVLKSVDVDTNEVEVALTKQSLDILSLETRFNPVSSIISIPNSKKNQFIFEHLNDVRERLTGVANNELEASLENQGIRIVDRGRLRVLKASQEKFEAILTDDGDFVYSAMEDLNWEDLWPELYGATGQTFFSNPSLYPVGRWVDNTIASMLNLAAGNAATLGFGYGAAKTMSDGVNDYMVVNDLTYPYSLCAPFLFVKDFFNRLETAMGLTFSSPLFADNNFLDAVIPLEELKVTERMSEYSAANYNITTPKNNNITAPFPFSNMNVLYSKWGSAQTVNTPNYSFSFTPPTTAFVEEPVNPTGTGSTRRYGKGTYNIRVSGVGNFTSAIMFIVARNGVLNTSGAYDIELFAGGVATNFDVEVTHEFPLLDGVAYDLDNYIDFVVVLANMTGGLENGVASFTLDVRLAEQPIQPYNPVDWTGLLPFEKPIDMFKAVQKHYGFTPSWEKYTKTCFLRPFSEVFGIGEDISDYVDWEQAEISIGWDSLARNNYIQFSEDNAPANIQVTGTALEEENTILEFDFQRTLPSSISALNRSDMATLEYHKGPFDFPIPPPIPLGFESGVGSAGTKICLLTSGALTVNFLRLMPLNPLDYGTFAPLGGSSYKSLRTLNLNVSQWIRSNYYAGLERFYSHPRKVSVPVHLPPEIFRRYDPMKLFFVKQANSYFFVERISNYLPNRPATAELILLD